MEGNEEPKDVWVDRCLDAWMDEWREGGEGEAQVKHERTVDGSRDGVMEVVREG